MSQGFDPTVPVFGSGLQSNPVRANLNALFSSNSGNTAPSNPALGTLWVDTSVPTNVTLKIYNGTAWVPLIFHLETPAAVTFAGSQSRFVFTQGPPVGTWVLVHNLNCFPSVTIVDATNFVIIPDTIHYDSANQITVTFVVPVSGQAFVN